MKPSSTAARLFELRERGLAASEARKPAPEPVTAAPAPAVGYRPPPCPDCSSAAVEPAGFPHERWCMHCDQRFRKYRDGWLIVESGVPERRRKPEPEEIDHAESR